MNMFRQRKYAQETGNSIDSSSL